MHCITLHKLEIGGSIGTNQKFLLDSEVVKIGRAPDNNLILSEHGLTPSCSARLGG